jgi:hypothetical protein
MGPQLINFESATATYAWTGIREAGHFVVQVDGVTTVWAMPHLARDGHFVGGLEVDVLAWPLGAAASEADSSDGQARTLTGVFAGGFLPTIIVHGANKSEPVKVTEIGADGAAEFLAGLSAEPVSV